MDKEETICLYGYPKTTSDGARLDEYTKLEFEDIMRDAIMRLGGTFCSESFEIYWSEAQERKRRSANNG